MKVLILFFLIWGSTEIFGCGLNLWDVGEDTLKKIGFAEEKIILIKGIAEEVKRKKPEIRLSLETAEAILSNMLRAEKVNIKKIGKLRKEIVRLRDKILETDINAILKIRKILTFEEYQKLLEISKGATEMEPCKRR